MAEAPVGDEPVFVDVGTGTEFPFESMAILKEVLNSSNTEPEVNLDASPAGDASPARDASTGHHASPARDAGAAESDPYLAIQQRRIRCTECVRFSTETEEKMTRHVRRVHRGENPFQCAMCEYSTYNKAVYEEHVRVHQGIKPFKCSHCSYRSASKKNTKKHELIHRPDNPNRCTICGFIAKHIRSLQSHQKQHTTQLQSDEAPYRCVYCKTIFQDDYTLVQHKKVCQMFQHRGAAEKIVKRQALKKKKVYTFKCAICKWSGNSSPRILLHLIHHPNQDIDEKLLDVNILRRCGIKIGLPVVNSPATP